MYPFTGVGQAGFASSKDCICMFYLYILNFTATLTSLPTPPLHRSLNFSTVYSRFQRSPVHSTNDMSVATPLRTLQPEKVLLPLLVFFAIGHPRFRCSLVPTIDVHRNSHNDENATAE